MGYVCTILVTLVAVPVAPINKFTAKLVHVFSLCNKFVWLL